MLSVDFLQVEHTDVLSGYIQSGHFPSQTLLSLSKFQVVTAILESGKTMSADQKKTERCPLLYEWHKKQYIGAAHGLAGIYYTLMQASDRKWLNGPTGWWKHGCFFCLNSEVLKT